MATNAVGSQLTLVEILNNIDPSGNQARVAETLTKMNSMMQDAPWLEANGQLEHRGVRDLKLPSGSWRQYNQGVASEEYQTVPYVESMGMLETYSEVDKALADRMPNPAAYRALRARRFIEGIGQTLATTLLYGNAGTDPEKFTGFQPRLNTLNDNVVGCGGTGSDLTSIYVIQWGPDMCHMIYPKGHTHAGIEHKDLGEMRIEDTADSTKHLQAYVDHFRVYGGLVIEDERCLGRVCNIESSGSTNSFNEDKLIEVINVLPFDAQGAVIYCNKTMKTRMQILLKDKTNVNFTMDGGNGLSGMPLMRFQGIPIRLMDAIVNTESAVS